MIAIWGVLAVSVSVTSFGQEALGEALPAPEATPVRTAADVLPPELIEGEYFSVVDEVGSYDSLNTYRIESEVGDFEAYGEMELRIRLREIKATVELEKISGARVAAQAAGTAVTDTAKAAGHVVAHPVSTAKALPGGIQRRFKSWGRTAKEVKKTIKERKSGDGEKTSKSKMAKDATRWYFGVDKAERKWAQTIGVDPYSTFPPLRAELKRVGKYDAGAAKGASFVSPKFPKELSYVQDTYKLVWATDPGELKELNEKGLAQLGASPDLVEAFFKTEALTPSLRTFLISALQEMEGVEDRFIPIEQALTVQTLTDSLFHIECVALASWFHSQDAGLKTFVRGTMVPAGIARDGRLMLFSAADFAYWSELTASGSQEFTDIYKELSETREVWLAGRATPLFIEGAEGLGWSVRTSLRREILPRLPWGMQ